jgi:hypothetical protein
MRESLLALLLVWVLLTHQKPDPRPRNSNLQAGPSGESYRICELI